MPINPAILNNSRQSSNRLSPVQHHTTSRIPSNHSSPGQATRHDTQMMVGHTSFLRTVAVFLWLPVFARAALHNECFLFDAHSEGSITIRNDWNWRSSAFFYESQDVWRTDIPIFITEDYFLEPNWGQKFGKCTLDLYAAGLCPKDELFVVHDLSTGDFLKADDNNRFVLARSNYTHHVQKDVPSVVCVMMYQNEKFGAKERRVDIIAEGTYDFIWLTEARLFTLTYTQLLIILAWMFIHFAGVVFNSNSTMFSSTSSGYIYLFASGMLVLSKLVALTLQLLLSVIFFSTTDPNSLACKLFFNPDSVLNLFTCEVILLHTLITVTIKLSQSTRTPLSIKDITRFHKVIWIPLFIKLVTLLPLSSNLLVVVDGLVKFSLALAAVSVWFRAQRALERMEEYPVGRTTRRSLALIVKLILCAILVLYIGSPLYKIRLIHKYALLPNKIHFIDWFHLEDLLTRVVPASRLTSYFTELALHTASFTPFVISGILSFVAWSMPDVDPGGLDYANKHW